MNRTLQILFVLLFSLVLMSCKKEETTQPPSNNAPGLVAYYPFNGSAYDACGNGYFVTVEGATLTSDRFNESSKAYNFDGIDDRITINYINFALRNNLTVSLWTKVPQQDLQYFVMCSYFGVFSMSNTVGLAISLPQTNAAEGQIAYDTWIHFIGTYDGTTIKAYINGELKDTTTWIGNIADTTRPLIFGNFDTGTYNYFWRGILDDVRIYNRVLSENEILQLYHEGGW